MAKHMLIYEPPYTASKRARAHIIEVAVAALGVLLGFVVQLVAGNTAVLATTPLEYLPTGIVRALGALLLAGGISVLIGLLVTRHDVSNEYAFERLGWLLLGGGWGAYAFAAFWFADGAILSIILGAVFAVAAPVRFWAVGEIHKQERALARLAGEAV